MQKLLYLFYFIILCSCKCPVWQCGNKAFTLGNYCAQHDTQIITVVSQNLACPKNYFCTLYDIVFDWFYWSDTYYQLGDCSQINEETDDGNYQVIRDQLFIRPDCYTDKFESLKKLCEKDKESEEFQDYQDEIDQINDKAKADLKKNWELCNSDQECVSQFCICTPRYDGQGRCASSIYERDIVQVAQYAAACNNDQATFCSLYELFNVELDYQDILKGSYWASVIERDFYCLEIEDFEDLQYADKVLNIRGAFDYYNEVSFGETLYMILGWLLLLL